MRKAIFVVLVILILSSLVLAGRSQTGVKVSLKVYSQIEKQDSARVIVTLKEEKKNNLDNNSIEGIKEEKIKHKFENSVSLEVSSKELEELKKNNQIESIDLINTREILLQDSTSLINATLTWPLEYLGINLTGKGESVCIIDTGINYNHPDLGNCYGDNDPNSNCKVIGGWDFCADDSTCITQDSDPLDVNGHGTHVSGIVGANGSIKGVAPDVKIIMIKAGNASGIFWDDDIRAAIDWCIDNSSIFNISVISMSLGGGLYSSYCDYQDDAANLTLAINNAIAKNISVVVAAGNDDSTTSITSPACIKNATPVGWLNKDDIINTNSNRNSIVQLMAPGTSINSTSITGGYESLQGSSMSAPHVAGSIAILNQILKITNQTKTPEQIEFVLNSTGKQISDSGSKRNYSRINLYNASLYLDNIKPSVTLSAPETSLVTTNNSFNFTCIIVDWQIENVTFYLWNSSSLVYNETKNISGFSNSSSFNYSLLNFDSYKWNCFAEDKKLNSAFASLNSTLVITQVFSSLIVPLNYSYTNTNNFSCSSQSEENSELTNVTFYLWNSSSLVYNETKNISGFSNSSSFNYSLLEEEYIWNCLSSNNNSLSSFAVSNYTLTYDITKPVISLISPFDTSYYISNSQQIVFLYNVTEQNISNCSLIINNEISLTNTSLINLSNLSFIQIFSPGSYVWSINCTDLAENKDNSSSKSFAISPPSLGSSGGGSSSITSKVVKKVEENKTQTNSITLETGENTKENIGEDKEKSNLDMINQERKENSGITGDVISLIKKERGYLGGLLLLFIIIGLYYILKIKQKIKKPLDFNNNKNNNEEFKTKPQREKALSSTRRKRRK